MNYLLEVGAPLGVLGGHFCSKVSRETLLGDNFGLSWHFESSFLLEVAFQDVFWSLCWAILALLVAILDPQRVDPQIIFESKLFDSNIEWTPRDSIAEYCSKSKIGSPRQ